MKYWKLTKEETLQKVKEIALKKGFAKYDNRLSYHVYKYFGNWKRACQIAGVKTERDFKKGDKQ